MTYLLKNLNQTETIKKAKVNLHSIRTKSIIIKMNLNKTDISANVYHVYESVLV